MNFTKYISLLLFAFTIGACYQAESTYVKIEPAKVEHIENSDFSRVELTERAVERIGIKTVQVATETAKGNNQTEQAVVPYSSILYDASGDSWVYTNPNPRNYIREQVKIDYINGDKAFLAEGPASGTVVVSQGAVELLGTEFHVGH